MKRFARRAVLITLGLTLAATGAWSQAREQGGGVPELQRQLRQVQDALCSLLGSIGSSDLVKCPNVLAPFKIAFLTSETYDANLGGLAGADFKCQALAQRSSLIDGIYRAWLSDSRLDVRDRMMHHPGPYRRPDGVLVALSWNDLVDGALVNPIDVSELGTTTSGATAWTATAPDGTLRISANTCNDWTSNVGPGGGNTGLFHFTNASWTQASGSVCEETLPLYCIEQ